MDDIAALAKGFAPVIREYVEKQVGPLVQRLDDAEKRIAELERAGLKYLGVYQRQVSYPRGAFVTHKGALWHANEGVTGVEPGDGKSWTLAVKSGGR